MAAKSTPVTALARANGAGRAERHLRRLEVLNELARAVSATLDVKAVGARAVEKLRELFPEARCACIRLLDDTGQWLEICEQWGYGPGHLLLWSRLSMEDDHAAARAAKSGEIQVNLDTRAQPPPGPAGLAEAMELRAYVALPLLDRGSAPDRSDALPSMLPASGCLGTLFVAWDAPTRLDADELELCRNIAHQVGLAISNARLFEEQVRAREALAAQASRHAEELSWRAREMEALFRLSSHISLSRDEATITASAIDYCLGLTTSEYGFLALLDASGEACVECVRGLNAAAEAEARARLEQPDFRLLYEAVLRGRAAFCQNLGDLSDGEALPLSPRSFLGVPLLCGERLVGAIGLVNKQAGYDEEDRRLVVMFANQVAVAVENARMVSQVQSSLERRRRELASLSQAAQELSSARDELSALQHVVKAINEALCAHSTWVMLYDEGMQTYTTRMFWNRGVVRFFQLTQPWDRGAVGEALTSGRPVFIPDVQVEEDFPFHGEAVTAGLRAMLAVPLIAHKRKLGILAIFTEEYSETQPPDWDFVQAFASQAAAAIQNARWHTDEEARTRRESRVNQITAAVRESIDVAKVMQAAVRHLGEALTAHRCIALLAQESGDYEEYLHCAPDCSVDTREILWELCPIVRQVEETRAPVTLARSTAPPEFAACAAVFTPAPESILAIPATRQGRLVGIFLFHQCDRERRWLPAELELAQRVADQVAIAVENALLFRRSVENERFQATLAETAAALAQSWEAPVPGGTPGDGPAGRAPATTAAAALEEVFRIVCRQGMRLLAADGAYVWQLNDASQELVGIVALGHKQEKFPGLRVPLSRRRSIGVQAVLQRRALVASSALESHYTNARLSRLFDAEALVAIPLIARDNVLGAVVFSTTQPGRPFEETDLRRAEILISQVATAVENAQLYEETRRRADELEILWSTSQKVSAELDPESVLRSVAEGARRLMNADAASIMLFDERRTAVRVAGADGLGPEAMRLVLPTDRPMPRCLAVDGTPHATADLRTDPVLKMLPAVTGLQAMLSVPLLGEKETAGALNVYARDRRQFSISDTKTLATLASFASVAMSNARTYQREHQIARTFEASLLPEQNVTIAGVDIAYRYIAALEGTQLGGDLHDVVRLKDGRVGLLIGDVAGKGLDAAVQLGRVKSVLRAFALESPGPSQMMTRLNHVLCQMAEQPEWFMTLFYGVLDVARGELVYANAGHERPMLMRGSVRDGQWTGGACLPAHGDRGDEPELLAVAGPILGLQAGARYREGHVRLGAGDTLVLFTDGFTEARRDDEFLQVEGLTRFLGEVRGADAGAIVERVCDSVSTFARGELHDDATILVVRTGEASGQGSPGSIPAAAGVASDG